MNELPSAKDLMSNKKELSERVLPVLEATREEVRLAQDLTNSLVDKFFDTGKLMLGFSLPALITIYSLKSNELRADIFWGLTIGLAIVGTILIATAFAIKFYTFKPYLSNTSARINLLTSLLELETEKSKPSKKTSNPR